MWYNVCVMKKVVRIICRGIDLPSMFCLMPEPVSHCNEAPEEYGSTEDLWRNDWNNIGIDFRRAVGNLVGSGEVVR